VQYALEFGITHKYYQPAAQGDDAYLNAIDLAVQGGAKVIVTPGFLFETPVYEAQEIYPHTKFQMLMSYG
jgi:basic membrane protein A